MVTEGIKDIMAIGMKHNKMLKIWREIENLSELEAKLALFGLAIQTIGQKEEKRQENE